MMTTAATSREQVIAILKSVRISPSEQRIAIYDFLLRNRVHPTVDMVFRNLVDTHPTLSRTTVYNTLKLLHDRNLVHSLNIDDGELRYDAENRPHAHFKCTRCHRIWDVFGVEEPHLPARKDEDFKVSFTQLNFYGLCSECREAGQPED